ncbi:MAG: FAD:protein FMN transferase [Allorhizobium sp.]
MSTDADAGNTDRRYSLNGATMGTRYSALFYAEPGADENAIGAALFAAVDTVDRQMSTWNAQSDLCRFNVAPIGAWISLPAQMLTVLSAALQVEKLSGGAFDIGVGDLVAAAGFGAGGTDYQAERVEALGRETPSHTVDCLEIEPGAGRARKLAPVTLDLSGIAKGFGVDEMARVLDRFAIASYLVGIDGEMRSRGTKPASEPWAVAVERPERGTRSVMGVMALQDQAVATSGDYRHFKQVGDRMLSHTMDPRSRQPLANALAAVSVLSSSCIEADALATALMVMGERDGPSFARAHRIDALFVVHDGENFKEIPVGPLWG